MNSIREKFLQVFRNVFEDDEVTPEDHQSAVDFPDWDSLRHINLIVAVEMAFNIRFATAEVSALSAPGQNVGTLLALVARKLGHAATSG